MKIRRARQTDIPVLVDIERRCFDTDRLSRRNFLWMMKRGHSAIYVAEVAGAIAGYVLVLFHAGTSLARLYSIATLPEVRGFGLGAALLKAAEAAAREDGSTSMRLEVRPDNTEAIRLYEKAGYRPFTVWPDYYEDHAEAIRYEKRIQYADPGTTRAIPFYAQTTEFTCGPAAVMMAMKALDPTLKLDRRLELRLWREATTIFMTSGHGGCSPRGLALAADRRGFGTEVFLSQKGPLFLDSVRNADKREVIRVVHEDFESRMREKKIQQHEWPRTTKKILDLIDAGHVPVVLTSNYRITQTKSPHYLVLTGYDQRFIYAHDPNVDEDLHKTETDCINVPIPLADFQKILRYGRSRLQAMVVIKAPRARGGAKAPL